MAELGLRHWSFTQRSPRHSGPSRDRIEQRLSPEAVRQRGRWRPVRAVKPHPRPAVRLERANAKIPSGLCGVPCFLRQGQLRRSRPAFAEQGSWFVGLYCGAGGVARRVTISGVNSLVSDLDYGFDILDNGHFSALIEFCVKRRVRGVTIVHPCESLSKARRALAWSRMPRRLRSPVCPTGLPELSGKDLKNCQLGNKILAQTRKQIRILQRKHIPFIVENPQSSYISETRDMVRPALARDTITVSCHQCQCGCAWKKPTKLLFSEGMSGHLIAKVCVPNHGKCGRTGDKHYVFLGHPDWRAAYSRSQDLQSPTLPCPRRHFCC